LIFRVRTPCIGMVGYQTFGAPENGGSTVLRNVGTLLHNYTVS